MVQDKLWLPGMQKLLALRQAGFFGRILSARLEFGWWVFDGFDRPMPRSDWNYRRAMQGGIILDMFTHWRYLIDALVGEVRAVCCTVATRQPRRRTPAGEVFDVDVEDEATALVEVEGGALVRVQASWARRVVDEDILTLAIDGTTGSAVAGVHHCRVQAAADTPLAVWNYRDRAAHAAGLATAWSPAPETPAPADSYRAGWEAFLRHLAGRAVFPPRSRPVRGACSSSRPATVPPPVGAGWTCRRMRPVAAAEGFDGRGVAAYPCRHRASGR